MYSDLLTTLLPNTPSLGAFERPYAPVHFDRAALAKLARARLPFWVRMAFQDPINPPGGPIDGSTYLLRYPGVKFDLEVWGASTNLDASFLKLIGATETQTSQMVASAALSGAVTTQRKIWRWATPLLVRAHTPMQVEIRYRTQPGGLVNATGWVVLHGVRLEKSS